MSFARVILGSTFWLLPALSVLPAAAGEATGEALFDEKCGRCHSFHRVAATLKKKPERERAPLLDAFLPNHHAPDAVERQRLIELLLGAAERRR